MPKKKRKKHPPYTQFTLKWLAKQSRCSAIVERRLPNFRFPMRGTKIDLFGVIDIVSLSLNRGKPSTIGVQSTSEKQLSQHLKTCRAEKRMRYWLWNNNRFWIVAWRKVLEGKAWRWRPRVVEFLYVTKGDATKLVKRELHNLPGQQA